jgi:uncharacterized pyridoxal phosphate-containing UPF0001 family protein
MSIADNLTRLQEQIADACRRANRSSDGVALMAVSKVHPVEAILEAYAAGHRLFGIISGQATGTNMRVIQVGGRLLF